jgi:hypothetical protein
MAHDIFISYAMADKATADAACAALEKEGVRCWIAPRDVIPGIDYAEAIIEAIERARGMLLVFSSHANRSNQVKREVERAVHHGIAIIPFRIEAVQPERALEYYISSPHWLDALTPPLERHLTQLTSTIKVLLNRSGTGETQAQALRQAFVQKQPAQSPTSAAVRDFSLWYLLGGLAVAFLAFCVLAIGIAVWIVNADRLRHLRVTPTPTPSIVQTTPVPTVAPIATPSATPTPTSTPIVESTPSPIYSPSVQASPSATYSASGTQKPTLGGILLQDDFETRKSYWGNLTKFWNISNGHMALYPQLNQFYSVFAQRGPFVDASVEIDVTMARGTDLTRPGGLIFWCKDNQDFYVLEINMTGFYAVYRRLHGKWIQIVRAVPVAAINQGVGQSNHLQVITQGSRAQLYVNDQELTSVAYPDANPGGFIGVYGESGTTQYLVWQFTHLKVSSLE